ncbi:ATP-binding protein [Paraburkholderia sp. CNPSo 3272]|uniref:ATP-binding protein n=1 Tax=Paraburkholderia sp. CNPSo 3272 TaxID=2940931 RepID=UPI0035CCD6FA
MRRISGSRAGASGKSCDRVIPLAYASRRIRGVLWGYFAISTAMNEPGAVLVTVCDSGPGVAPESVERLLSRFIRQRLSVGAWGSICRSIIEAHGGRLWASANGTPRRCL